MASTNDHNPGMPLDLDWVMGARVNRSAVERRTATLPARRSIKKEWQAAWLLRAITCLDLTTLSGDDTPGRVKRLCAKAKQPVRPDMLARLGGRGGAGPERGTGVLRRVVRLGVRAGSAAPRRAVS